MSPPTPSCSASVPRVGGGAAADARSSGAPHGTQPVRPPAAPPPDRWSGVFGGRGEGVVVAARVIGWCTCTWRQQGGNLVHPSPSCKLSHTRTRTHMVQRAPGQPSGGKKGVFHGGVWAVRAKERRGVDQARGV